MSQKEKPMKTALQSTATGLLALTLGALCLADSSKPPDSAKPPAGAAKGKWKSSVGTTTVEGLPAKHIASLPDLVVVPVEGEGYWGFRVRNMGKSPTKSSTTLSFQCWKEPKAGQFYESVPCPIPSAMIGPLALRSSSTVFKITWVDGPLGWKVAATVDKQNSIPEVNETNNIAQWDYVPVTQYF